jgi:hypothetical protein
MADPDYSIFTPLGAKWVQQPLTNLHAIRTGQMVSVDSEPKPLPATQPFNVTDIPDAMQKMGWHVAAALLNKWFHYSPKNQAQNKFQKRDGYNPDGSGGYPLDRIDKTTVKLDWILSFDRAAKGFKELQNPFRLSTYGAIQQLINKLHSYKNHATTLDTLQLCGNDIHRLHHNFQFQLFTVDTSR